MPDRETSISIPRPRGKLTSQYPNKRGDISYSRLFRHRPLHRPLHPPVLLPQQRRDRLDLRDLRSTVRNSPLTPPPLRARATYTWQGYTGEIEAPVEVALPEPHPLIVGPAVSVATSPVTRVMQKGSSGADVTASLFANQPSKDAVTISADAPKGWTTTSSPAGTLTQPGQIASAAVSLKPDSVPKRNTKFR